MPQPRAQPEGVVGFKKMGEDEEQQDVTCRCRPAMRCETPNNRFGFAWRTLLETGDEGRGGLPDDGQNVTRGTKRLLGVGAQRISSRMLAVTLVYNPTGRQVHRRLDLRGRSEHAELARGEKR